MTTNDAAAAQKLFKRFSLAVIGLATATTLAGCETTGSLLPSSGTPVSNVAPQQAPQAPQQPRTTLAVAPVIGAPDAVSQQIAQQLGGSFSQRAIAVAASPADRADYTLRGYIVAARERAGTKVSYIWDVTDATGKRLNRITGEETVPNGAGKDPWSSVGPAVTQSIADKTATSVASWLASSGAPGQPAPVAAQPAIAGNAIQPAAVGGVPIATQTAPTIGDARSTASLQPIAATTASIPAADAPTLVANVTGAPGDGPTSLSRALQKELQRNGVPLAGSQQAASAYKVEGKVALGSAANGKQPIQIDWLVKDPAGRRLGTVSQKNEIPAGSLDGSWGEVADAAAAAAAQGVLKLLPQGQAKAVN